MKFPKNKMIKKIISVLVFVNIYYFALYCKSIHDYFLIHNRSGTIFYRFFETFFSFYILFSVHIFLELLLCFTSSKIKIKFLRAILEFSIPAVMIFWFFYQVKYGQGPQGEADISEFSSFSERLFASFYENVPLIASVLLIRNIYFNAHTHGKARARH